jgi:hypothetical protein
MEFSNEHTQRSRDHLSSYIYTNFIKDEKRKISLEKEKPMMGL